MRKIWDRIKAKLGLAYPMHEVTECHAEPHVRGRGYAYFSVEQQEPEEMARYIPPHPTVHDMLQTYPGVFYQHTPYGVMGYETNRSTTSDVRISCSYSPDKGVHYIDIDDADPDTFVVTVDSVRYKLVRDDCEDED